MAAVPLEVYISSAQYLMFWTHTEERQCSNDTGDGFYWTNSDEQLRGEEDEESYAIQIGDLVEYHLLLFIEVAIVIWVFERVELVMR
jgi:hypothetical protein